jgi:Glycosyl hydrolases family 18
MSNEVFINYWIGQETNPPSPTLRQMPAHVTIAPLAFVHIDTSNWQLDFRFLTQTFSAETIQGWIKTVQANGTKVLLSIIGQELGSVPASEQAGFVANVAQNVTAWGVDGLDLDYEPPEDSTTLVPLIQALRAALPKGSVFTAPIFQPWISTPKLLRALAGAVDYITTMDYSKYPGYDKTIQLCTSYAEIIGGWSQLAIGISCMGPPESGNFTPLDDVVKLAAYVPPGGVKGGAMLYTFSYDVTSRKGGNLYPQAGTGQPDGTWTQTIEKNLP